MGDVMILEPGLLNDLSGDGQAEWEKYVIDELATAKSRSGSDQLVLPNDSELEPSIHIVDWKGLPVRIRKCLQSTNKTQELLDWTHNGQPYGRILGAQEEYLEWRVVKDTLGRIIKIEFTSEVPEYWSILAKHHPARTLRLLADFAGEMNSANPIDVYGIDDPYSLPVEERGKAFDSMMFPSDSSPDILSPYNNGQKSIACMAVGPNTLHAAIFLAAYASLPYVKIRDNNKIALTGREAIRFTRQAAQDCRDSDPTIVGTVIKDAVRQRKISLFNPLGLYIADIDSESILMPNGETPIPHEWFTFQRGSKVESAGNSISLSQRLVFEVPKSTGLTISDLIDADTDKPIKFGSQIASKTTVALYALTSKDNVTNVPLKDIEVEAVPPCRKEEACDRVKKTYNAFKDSKKSSAFIKEPSANLRAMIDGG